MIYIILMAILSGCTYSINMVHTQGIADDVVDETQSAKPDIQAHLSGPLG